MYLYNTLFSKYNIQCAQVLVTETDIYQDSNRKVLRDVLRKLMELKVIPILNTNDAVLPQPECPCKYELFIKIIESIQNSNTNYHFFKINFKHL